MRFRCWDRFKCFWHFSGFFWNGLYIVFLVFSDFLKKKFDQIFSEIFSKAFLWFRIFFLKSYAHNFLYDFQKFCNYKLNTFSKTFLNSILILFITQNNFWNFCQDFLTSMMTSKFSEFSEFSRTLFWRFPETFLIFSQNSETKNRDNCKLKSFEISIFKIHQNFPTKTAKRGIIC